MSRTVPARSRPAPRRSWAARPYRHRAAGAAALFALLALTACGGSDSTAPPPPAVTIAVTPSTTTVDAGATVQFSATVANSTNTGVTWTTSGGNIAPSGTSATWTAPGTGGNYTVTATSTADATKSATATVTVTAVGLAVSPATATIGAGDTVALAATVTNAANGAVTWSSSAGAIVGTGTSVQWAAPVAGGTYTVTATSVLDPARTASATITVTPVTVAVTAQSAVLFRGEGTTLTTTVGGTSDPRVVWTTSCGTLTGTGATVQYTAPSAPGPCTVRATSVRDPATSGTATVTTRAAWRVAATNDVDDGACTYQHCSLREALNAANATPGRDSIILVPPAAGPGTAARASALTTATITLTAPLPFVNSPVDIVGPGATQLAIDAAASATTQRGVLYVDGDITASIRGVTLRGGHRAGGGGLVIDNKAQVTLRDVHVRDNVSAGAPGGGVLAIREGRGTFIDVEIIGNRSTGANGPGGGLSVETTSQVTWTRGRLADNVAEASFGGGARLFNSTLAMDSVVVANNRVLAGPGLGGGIFADGPTGVFQLLRSAVEANQATTAGGGLCIRGGVTATITGTTIRTNSAPIGGGIETGGSPVTVANSDLIGNTATTRAAGVIVFGTGTYTHTGGSIRTNIAGGAGGGLYLQQDAKATLTNVAIDDNEANGNQSGGGIWTGNASELTMTGGSISRNRAATVGGGIFSNATGGFRLTSVAVDSNQAAQGGGGVLVNASAPVTITGGRFVGNAAGTGGGGAMYAQTVTLVVDGTTFAGNTAGQGGGAVLAFTPGTFTIRNAIAEDNVANLGGAYGFSGALTATVEGGIIRRNRSTTVGGGVWKTGASELTMTGTQVLDNVAGTQGGGIQLVGPGAAATLRRLTVRGNTATTASGGGLTSGVPVLVEESTFSGNTTGAIGGGIFAALTGNATVRNSTFSGNSAVVGGGIAATGPATLVNLTFVGNSASDYGGGIGTNNAGAMTVTNVLLAGNLVAGNAGNCGSGGASTITSAGGNLSGDATCATFTQGSDKPNTAPGVSTTLAANGGPTPTHALLEGSAAINAGLPGACPATDQRGAPRVGTCDIGAFEFGGQPPAAGQGATVRKR